MPAYQWDELLSGPPAHQAQDWSLTFPISSPDAQHAENPLFSCPPSSRSASAILYKNKRKQKIIMKASRSQPNIIMYPVYNGCTEGYKKMLLSNAHKWQISPMHELKTPDYKNTSVLNNEELAVVSAFKQYFHTFLLCLKWLSSITTYSCLPPNCCPFLLLLLFIAQIHTSRSFFDIFEREVELLDMSSIIMSTCLKRSPCENLKKSITNN